MVRRRRLLRPMRGSSMPTHMTVATSQATLASLRTKLAELENRKALLSDEIASISFEVHVGGDAAVRKKFDDLVREGLALDAEAAGLAAAIKTGEQRVIEAQAAEHAEIERQKAEAALKLGRDMADAAQIADRNF